MLPALCVLFFLDAKCTLPIVCLLDRQRRETRKQWPLLVDEDAKVHQSQKKHLYEPWQDADHTQND